MGERMGEGMHIESESVNRIEWGVIKHENGCRLMVQIKRAWEVVRVEVLLLLAVSTEEIETRLG